MASILFKWLVIAAIGFMPVTGMHPVYISVTEIEHNAANKTLEISCKLFIDDLEKTLRRDYAGKVDLLHPESTETMNRIVSEYIVQHLKIKINGTNVNLKFLGYEQIEEGLYCFFQAEGIAQVKSIGIFNNLLYENYPEQIGIMHIKVNGIRKSAKLINPDNKTVLSF